MAVLQKDDITQLLSGAMLALHEEGAYLAGGHTSQAQDLQVGFAVTGLSEHKDIYKPKDGDALILTKPLGIGLIMAGHQQGHPIATGLVRDAAIDVMCQSNGKAAQILNKFGIYPMTDVTGFGFIRHTYSLLEQIDDGLGSADIITSALPYIDGVIELALDHISSSILSKNMISAPVIGQTSFPQSILHDPQTGGGLLAIVPHEDAHNIASALIDDGLQAAHIGWYKQDRQSSVRIADTW